MALDTKQQIAGIPILKMRDFLRETRRAFSSSSIAGFFALADEKAAEGARELVRQGLIERTEEYRGEQFYRNTMAGNRLASQKAIKRISRDKADQLLKALLERCDGVNARDELGYVVERVRVFGSYIDLSKADLGDIDLVVDLKWRDDSRDQSNYGYERADASGKPFSSSIAAMFYSHAEVMQILKARSPYLSFHEERDLKATGAEAVQVFPKPGLG